MEFEFKLFFFRILIVYIEQDIGRNSGRQMRAGAGRLGGGGGILGGGGVGPHGTNDDFWLPKVKYFEPNNVKLSA